tara:strand:+ start:950 stop:2152 length:1203 start_codon:yes stop_codon:yes gene_type:complete
MTNQYEIRPISDKEFGKFSETSARAFGFDQDAGYLSLKKSYFDFDRTLAVIHNNGIVGGCVSSKYLLNIPGNQANVAAISDVSVLPNHRRKGLLTKMMRSQLLDLHDRGELFAALWAEESPIYGRFGYGIGSLHENWIIHRQNNAFNTRINDNGIVEYIDQTKIEELLPKIYKNATTDVPAVIQRPEMYWKVISEDFESKRNNESKMQHVIYRLDKDIKGYASYRTVSEGISIHELMATDLNSTVGLWRFCLDMDLRLQAQIYRRPLDDILPMLLIDPGKLSRTIKEGLWLRLLNVQKALELRKYSLETRLVLKVIDSFCDWNNQTFELHASDNENLCTPSSLKPDICISASDLASVYLGTLKFSTLLKCGRIQIETDTAVLKADMMFSYKHAPWSPFYF